MALKFVDERFSKPGKGFPQVEQLNSDGTPILKDGKPVIGNEQYIARQLTSWEETDEDGKVTVVESVSFESVDAFLKDALEACDNSLEKVAECFRTGWNRKTRIESAGLDEYQKAAKNIIKLKLPMAKGLSLDELAEKLRTLNQ